MILLYDHILELVQEGQVKALESCWYEKRKNTHISANYAHHYGGEDCPFNFACILFDIWPPFYSLAMALSRYSFPCTRYTVMLYSGSHVFSRWPRNVVDVIILRTWFFFLLNPWPRKHILWHWNHDCRSRSFRDIQILYVWRTYFSRWPPNMVDVIVLRNWKCFQLNPWPRKHWNHDCRSLNFRDIHIYMCGRHVFQDGRQTR